MQEPPRGTEGTPGLWDCLPLWADRLGLPGMACRQVLLERDGSVTFRFLGAGRRAAVRWVPPGVPVDPSLSHPGLPGLLWLHDLAPEDLGDFPDRLAALASTEPLLGWGPGEEAVLPFTEQTWAAVLSPWLIPGVTTWGTYRLVDLFRPVPDGLEFRFQQPDQPPLVFRLAPIRVPGDPPGVRLCGLRELSFRVVQDPRPPGERGRLAEQPERLAGFAVARLLVRGARLRVPPGGVEDPPVQDSAAPPLAPDSYLQRFYPRVRHEAFIRRWDATDRWRRFHYPLSRCIVNLFQPGPKDSLVIHESRECVFSESPWVPPDGTFFRYGRDVQVGGWHRECDVRMTDLHGPVVLAGHTMRRLEQAIEGAVADPDRDAVVLMTGCLPDVIGDNPVPLFRKAAARTRARFYWLGAANDFGGYTSRLLRDRLEAAAPAQAPRDPRGVAVLGGGSSEEDRELLELTGTIGARPLGVVLPRVGREEFQRIAEASVLVWARQTALSDISELAFDGLPVRLVRPRAPFGREGTLAWLREVARHLPDPEAALQAVDTLDQRSRDAWETLRGRASGHVLAFVTDLEELDLLLDTTPVNAFSMLDVLLEMGFLVRFLVWPEGNDPAFLQERLARHPLARRLSMQFFEDPDDLTRKMAAQDVSLVYSHFTADPRVTRAGKGVFSEHDLEMGLQGARRSLERWLRAAEHLPLRAFATYLAGGAR
ncbi:MAG TPA: nitrogenase component 1 [Myxococcota bacterium]|nr:nitrogenase component 1 [Myxococcota bacterium]HQK51660.1 nitrogenase component 1 [Myxococcota bacterium]